jgi:copper(I)-binding protein
MPRFFPRASHALHSFHLAFRHNVEQTLGLAALAIALVLILAQAASAHEFRVGDLTLEHPWSRATPPGAAVGAGYLVIDNGGAEADRLVSATADDVCGHVEIHRMAVENGVMTMSPIPGGLEIPAGGSVTLEPGSFHLMLMDLKRELKEGETFSASLTFEKAGTIDVEFQVDSMGADGAMMGHDH